MEMPSFYHLKFLRLLYKQDTMGITPFQLWYNILTKNEVTSIVVVPDWRLSSSSYVWITPYPT